MCLSHGQVMSKVYLSELYLYLSRTIGHRFWRTLHYDIQSYTVGLHRSMGPIYCAFHKHANSKVQRPHLHYCNKQQILQHRNLQNGLKSTNHRSQTMTFWTCLCKVLFPKRSANMIDSSKKRKHQLAFELQSSCVFEKCSKLTCSR